VVEMPIEKFSRVREVASKFRKKSINLLLALSLAGTISAHGKIARADTFAPSSALVGKTNSISIYGEYTPKKYNLFYASYEKPIGKKTGFLIDLSNIKFGGETEYRKIGASLSREFGKIFLGGGIEIPALKGQKLTGRAGLAVFLPKNIMITGKAFGIGDSKEFFTALEANTPIKEWLSITANHLWMGGGKRDVQIGGSIRLPKKILGHPITLNFLKSIERNYDDYEVRLSPDAIRIGEREIMVTVGLKHQPTGYEGNLLLIIPMTKKQVKR